MAEFLGYNRPRNSRLWFREKYTNNVNFRRKCIEMYFPGNETFIKNIMAEDARINGLALGSTDRYKAEGFLLWQYMRPKYQAQIREEYKSDAHKILCMILKEFTSHGTDGDQLSQLYENVSAGIFAEVADEGVVDVVVDVVIEAAAEAIAEMIVNDVWLVECGICFDTCASLVNICTYSQLHDCCASCAARLRQDRALCPFCRSPLRLLRGAFCVRETELSE